MTVAEQSLLPASAVSSARTFFSYYFMWTREEQRCSADTPMSPAGNKEQEISLCTGCNLVSPGKNLLVMFSSVNYSSFSNFTVSAKCGRFSGSQVEPRYSANLTSSWEMVMLLACAPQLGTKERDVMLRWHRGQV